jgi:hypothetical protein
MVGEAALITGSGLTVTVTVVVFTQLFTSVPVMVYVVVVVGPAVKLVPVVPDNPVAGDQAYVDAPPAVSVVDEPLHIATAGGVQVIVGNGLTVTVVVVEPVHPAAVVPVMVYVVVLVGFAVTLDPDVPERPVAGDHA